MAILPVLALVAAVIGPPLPSEVAPSIPDDVRLKRTVRLRTAPDGRSEDRVRVGMPVEPLEREGSWIRVRTAGASTGWVHERDLDRRLPDIIVVEREPEVETETTDDAPSDEPMEIPARIVAFEAPPASPAPMPFAAPANAGVPALVSTPQGPIRVRLTPLPADARLVRAPNPGGGLVASLGTGTEVQFLARSGDYVRVRTREGLDGWLPMSALRPVAFPPPSLALLAPVSAASLVGERVR